MVKEHAEELARASDGGSAEMSGDGVNRIIVQNFRLCWEDSQAGD